jgi:cyclopropane fatty-acyl-phospholipid synthase-like methyltransferase
VRALRLAALLAGATLAFAAWAQHSAQQHHRFDGAEQWARVFDDPERDAWQKPDEVIRALRLPPGAKVADIGAGTGYFAVRLARAVAGGRVYAADAEPDMVRYLGERAKREGLANLAPVQAGEREARVPEPVDVALLVDVYHHIPARADYFAALRASLTPEGRVAIIDFRLDSPRGPPRRARVPPDVVKQELARAGYALVAEHDFLPDQYFLVFAPAGR